MEISSSELRTILIRHVKRFHPYWREFGGFVVKADVIGRGLNRKLVWEQDLCDYDERFEVRLIEPCSSVALKMVLPVRFFDLRGLDEIGFKYVLFLSSCFDHRYPSFSQFWKKLLKNEKLYNKMRKHVSSVMELADDRLVFSIDSYRYLRVARLEDLELDGIAEDLVVYSEDTNEKGKHWLKTFLRGGKYHDDLIEVIDDV